MCWKLEEQNSEWQYTLGIIGKYCVRRSEKFIWEGSRGLRDRNQGAR